MARKLIDQEEAARLLGVSVEEVNKMRDRRELFPYRDGDQWKYKPEDIERAIQDRAAGGGSSIHVGPTAGLPGEGVDSILLSEKELGQSADSTSSTIIGKGSPHGPVTESDIRLADDPLASDVKLAAGSSGIGSDVKLVFGGSDIKAGSGAKKGSDVKKTEASALDDLKLEPAGSSKSGSKSGASDLLRFADDEIQLEMSGPGSSSKKRKGSGSDPKKAGGSGSAKTIDLGDDDVLSMKPGSDITRGAADSGIHLIDPKDSGLSLEEPLVLGGSGKEMLELGEADVISLEETADMEGATQLKSDEDFLLTPVQETSSDEADSGSQVIALDSDEEMSSGAFTPASSGMVAMLEEDTGAEGMVGMPAGGALSAGTALATTPSVPEAPYSIWNVIGMLCCILLLMLTGMVMHDLVRNIWKWDGVSQVNSSIFDGIEKTVGWMDK